MTTALCFHGIGKNMFDIELEKFKSYIDELEDNNYSFISYNDFLKSRKKNEILLTFDDGLKTVKTKIHPLLKKRDIPALLFVVTSKLGKRETETFANIVEKREYITKKDLSNLSKYYDIGSHTHTHFQNNGKKSSFIIKDVLTSKKIIKLITGKYPKTFAYTHGYYDKRYVELIKKINFESAFALRNNLHTPFFNYNTKYTIARLPVDNYNNYPDIVSAIKKFTIFNQKIYWIKNKIKNVRYFRMPKL